MEVNPRYINFLFTPSISPALYRFLPTEGVERLCYRYPDEWNQWSVRATPKIVKDWITEYYIDNNWTISLLLKCLNVETLSDCEFDIHFEEFTQRSVEMAKEAKTIRHWLRFTLMQKSGMIGSLNVAVQFCSFKVEFHHCRVTPWSVMFSWQKYVQKANR